MQLVWYVAYGSNVGRARFRCYLAGGRPQGGHRVYAGCRDRRDPTQELSLDVPGRLVFAGLSRVWGGGKAFYDVAAEGSVAARAYLVTVEQFADVAAQEMWSPPGGPYARRIVESLPDMADIHVYGPGDYETLHRLGEHDGAPLMTVTSDRIARLEPSAPSAPYLWWIATGLRDAHGWTPDQVGDYLSDVVGARGVWSSADVAALLEQPAPMSAG